jgi:hypothetical protein
MVLQLPLLLGFSRPSIQGFFPRMFSLMNILLSVSPSVSASFFLLKSFHQDCARARLCVKMPCASSEGNTLTKDGVNTIKGDAIL